MSINRVQRFKRTLVSAVTRAVVRAIGEGKRAAAAVAGPAVTGGQSFSYVENKTAGYNIGTVLATDPVAITQFRFAATGTGTSSDGFFAISSGGVVTLTAAGALSTANDYDDVGGGAANTFTPTVQAGNASNVWSTPATVTINVLDVDDTPPVVTASQTISYVESQSSGAVIGAVAATDNVGVTGYRFTATGTNTSSDGNYQINSAGVVTITVAGVAGTMNDYDDGSNIVSHSVQAGDAAGNWSASVSVAFNVTNSAADDPSAMQFGLNMSGTANYSQGTPWANLLYMMGTPSRVSGTTDYDDDQGVITTASSTDVFRWTVYDAAFGDVPGIFGEYTLLNPSGANIGVGSTDHNFITFSTATSRTITYSGGTLCFYTRGSTPMSSGPPALVKTSNLTSWNGGCVWSPEFLSFHTGLKERVMRMMDWLYASASVETNWADRVLPSKVSLCKPGAAGVPWEFVIDIANRLGIDPWIHIPSRATDTFVTNLKAMWDNGTGRVAVPNISAQMNTTGLGSGRVAYLAVGNETWNENIPWVMGHQWFLYLNHTKYDVTVSPLVDPEIFNWPGHGLTTGDPLALFTTLANTVRGLTDANPAAGPTSGEIYRVMYGLRNGNIRALVLDANNIKVQYTDWDNVTVRTMSCPTVSQYSGQTFTTLTFKAVKPAALVVDNTNMNANFGTRCKEIWAPFQSAMGSRVQTILESFAVGDFYTSERLAPTGVAAATNMVAIAPYIDGEEMMATIDLLDGTSFKPRFYCSQTGHVYVNVFPAGTAQPPDDDLIAHTGAVSGHDWDYTGSSNSFQAGTNETGLTTGVSHDVYISFKNNSNASRAKYLWTFKGTITPAANKVGTSTTSVSVGSGSKVFTTQTGESYVANQAITVYSTADENDYMEGFVNSYNSATGALDVNVGRWGGSGGTFASWKIGTRQYVYDTFANQQCRNEIDTDLSGMAYIAAHKARIAASANTAIKLACYESGNHMQGHGEPWEMADWIRLQYLESAEYANALERNMRQYASEPSMAIQCIFSEITKTVWEIASSHFDTTDARYVKLASLNGVVARSTRVAVSDVSVGNVTDPGAYPTTLTTMPDGSLTYEILSGDGHRNFSFVGAALKINNATGINWAASVVRRLYCRASNGTTDCLFEINMVTGPALWYPVSATFAWLAKNDSTPAAMNPTVGVAMPSTTAATVVSDGWDMNDVADYGGGTGGATGPMVYSDSPLFAVAFRQSAETGSWETPVQFGTNPAVQMLTQGSNILVSIDNGGGTNVSLNVPISNTMAIVAVWVDNANSKVYILKNTTVQNAGGSAFASDGVHTQFTNFTRIGGASQYVFSGALETPAVGSLANAQSIIQAMKTEIGF